MEEKQITLSGCYGAGTNHLRLLLGLVPGKEIRDFSGRRLSDDKKLYFCTNIQYHNNITSTESNAKSSVLLDPSNILVN